MTSCYRVIQDYVYKTKESYSVPNFADPNNVKILKIYDSDYCNGFAKCEFIDEGLDYPSSYTCQYKSNYDINFLACDDLTYDPNCNKAFVNKVNLQQSAKLFECMSYNPFICIRILSTFLASTPYTSKMIGIITQLRSLFSDILVNSSSGINVSNTHQSVDEKSGVKSFFTKRFDNL